MLLGDENFVFLLCLSIPLQSAPLKNFFDAASGMFESLQHNIGSLSLRMWFPLCGVTVVQIAGSPLTHQ